MREPFHPVTKVLIGIFCALVVIGLVSVGYGNGHDDGYKMGKFDADWNCRMKGKP